MVLWWVDGINGLPQPYHDVPPHGLDFTCRYGMFVLMMIHGWVAE